MRYPATLRRDDTGGYYLRFPDVPGANTGDDDRESTLAGAADCLAVALETYMEQGRDIPLPSKPKKGQYLVSVPIRCRISDRASVVAQSNLYRGCSPGKPNPTA
jgi:antitoxin HicB